jgi:hypothetical protein
MIEVDRRVFLSGTPSLITRCPACCLPRHTLVNSCPSPRMSLRWACYACRLVDKAVQELQDTERALCSHLNTLAIILLRGIPDGGGRAVGSEAGKAAGSPGDADLQGKGKVVARSFEGEFSFSLVQDLL